MKPLRIFAPVWGDAHIRQFEMAILKSFGWPENYAALEDNIRSWHIYTMPADEGKLTGLMKRTAQPFQIHFLKPFSDEKGRLEELTNAGLEVMAACVKDQSLFFTGESDFVFADGSIEPMLALAQRPRVTVTVPHMRVLPPFLDLLDHPVSCSEMVGMAMKHAHPTWTDGQIGIKGFFRTFSNQFYGGLSWERLGNLYLVQHVIPNAWIANIEPSDLEFMKACRVWSAWDHILPSKFIKEGRNRIIGSSDAAFIVEITELNDRNAPGSHIDMKNPDAFYRDAYPNEEHHNAYRMCVSVFREAS